MAFGFVAALVGCGPRDPLALALPARAEPLTYVIGLFSAQELVAGQVSAGRLDQLPFWDDATVDRVEVITLGAAPEALNVLEGPLSRTQPTGPAATLGGLLARSAERAPVELYTWTSTQAALVPSPGAPSPGLLEAYVPARTACAPIERRVVDSTVAVDLVGAELVTGDRALLHGVDRVTGEARFGYATRDTVRWTGRWPRPALAFGRGLGSKAIALVDEGEGGYALVTVDYEGRVRDPTVALGRFATPPRLATTTVDPALVYTPDRVLEVWLVYPEVRDVTAAWGLRPMTVALAAEGSRDPPLVLAVDANTDVWQRRGLEWTREDNLAPRPEGLSIQLAASRRRAWAIDGNRVWQRDDTATRWRRADPSDEPTRTLVLADETRAVAVAASGATFVHDGTAWCPSGEPIDRTHELLTGGRGDVIARVRGGGAPATWALAWWSP